MSDKITIYLFQSISFNLKSDEMDKIIEFLTPLAKRTCFAHGNVELWNTFSSDQNSSDVSFLQHALSIRNFSQALSDMVESVLEIENDTNKKLRDYCEDLKKDLKKCLLIRIYHFHQSVRPLI